MNSLWRDIVYGVRVLARSPGFSIIVILTLALGIGANTAIFGVVDAVLLRPLPFPDPDRLVVVWERPEPRPDQPTEIMYASPPNYADWREREDVFEQLGAFVARDYFLMRDDGRGTLRVRGAEVTADLFPALGATPAVGRAFSPDDDGPGAAPVAIIGHSLWQREYGGDSDVLDQSVRLDDGVYRIVGVMPPGFEFPPAIDLYGRSAARETEVWIPSATDPRGESRGAHYLTVVGRLRPGVTLERARTEMDALAAVLAERYPDTNAGRGVRLSPLDEVVAGEAGPALLVLLGAVGLLLLIACVNVANLLVARAIDREREFAIRTALGAGRGALVRQALVESQLLALAGGALGVLLAFVVLGGLVRIAPQDVPRLDEAAIDWTALAFALGVTIATGLLFGLAPVIRTRVDRLAAVLKAGGRTDGDAGRVRLRHGVVVAEVALSLVLLVGGGLLFRSFLSLRGVDAGVVAERVITARLTLPGDAYPDGPRVAATFREIEDRLRSLPDVASAGFTADVPLATDFQGTVLNVENLTPAEGEQWLSHFTVVTPGYFDALGVPVAAGRAFDARDDADGEPSVIVNETIVRQYLDGRDPLGLRVLFDQPRTIVGVVGDVRLETLRDEPTPAFYLPHAQVAAGQRSMSLVVRHQGTAEAVVNAVRNEILAVDPAVPVYDVRTMDGIMGERLGRPRFSAYMMLTFSLLALTLAGVGIYGVISYLVGRRRREMGVRIALGASPAQAMGLVVRQGLRLVAVGVGIGFVAALAASRWLESQLFDVAPTDPAVFAGVSAFMLLVGLAASAIPARRAAGIQPIEALRID
ncbi:MAG: ABC transporter permease [Gemmatimonadota bacterium]